MESVLLITTIIIPVVLSHTLPENFERCHLKDPNLDNCLKTTIENAFRFIGSSGIPSINFPPLEPLEATRIEIGAGSSAVNLVQKYKDIKIYGYVNSTVKDAHLDLDKKVLTFTTYAPNMTQRAQYEVNGKIMMLPIFGSGESTINLFGLTTIHTLSFKEEVRKSKTYYKLVSYVTRISVENVHFELENLFNGDKQLADNILKVINDNAVTLFNDDKEGIQIAYSEVYKNVASRLFHNVPVDEIFLP